MQPSHNGVAWKATARAGMYLRKGGVVDVRGTRQARTRAGKDGNERTSEEINAFSVEFLSRQRPPAQAPGTAGAGA
jgi:single-stranded DNA-binding protein